ncbi:hypothetical protein GCM10023314_04210 [Algibacter agarivorans]|uniref:Big-1 domain-containing protein n=1 Tax=Algibacter agarivorans TaxID=1109741 RepID=A0ABP9GDJ2_9FLAO
MKSLRYYYIFFLLSALLYVFTACSSDDSDNQSIELNILVLDANSQEPIAGALIEVCNNAIYCSNLLASGTTNVNGKIRLSFSRKADKAISESFTVYKDSYRNSTSILDQLDLSQEIGLNTKSCGVFKIG